MFALTTSLFSGNASLWERLSEWYRESAIKAFLDAIEEQFFSVDIGTYENFSVSSGLGATVQTVVLALMVVSFIHKRLKPDQIPSGRGFAAFFGILMGTTTQLANAAGPISSIYLLAMRLPKEKYLGCCAWYFLILNWIKLPIFVAEGRITWSSFQLDLCMIPFIIIGGALGIFLLRKLPQKIFEVIIQALVVVAALRLLW